MVRSFGLIGQNSGHAGGLNSSHRTFDNLCIYMYNEGAAPSEPECEFVCSFLGLVLCPTIHIYIYGYIYVNIYIYIYIY